MAQHFEEFRKAVQRQSVETMTRFLEVNDDLMGLVVKHGVRCEYVEEYDHLYVTIGQPREGMALFFGSSVAICDPDTLELYAIEVPDFPEEYCHGNVNGVFGDCRDCEVPGRSHTACTARGRFSIPARTRQRAIARDLCLTPSAQRPKLEWELRRAYPRLRRLWILRRCAPQNDS